MSKKAWILWALILMVPGAIGMGYHFAQKDALYSQIAVAAEAVAENPAAEEYLSMYDRWVALLPEDKSENPWGQDPYGGPEIQKRVKDGQADRLMADLAELDKGVKHYPEELAETLYGYGWENSLKQYRQDREKAEMMLIGSVFLLAGSGVILVGGLGKIFVSVCFRKGKNRDSEVTDEETAAESQKKPEIKEKPPLTFSRSQPLSDMEKMIVSNSEKKDEPDAVGADDAPGYFESKKTVAQSSDRSSTTLTEKSPLPALSELEATAVSVAEKPAKDSYFGWSVDSDEDPDPTLETLMTTEPLTKELTELTEEMSAIREFAAQQQDQVRKLQDGYDWMIVRRFCMRIIRCADNIDDRIGRLDEQQDELALCLEDIRDELIFSLESSGVEQFNPDLNMPFKGLEKYAEAVRRRVETEDPSLSGCIAEVSRPGYQYLISEDDVKVVRCAQVKLYDVKTE